MIFYKTDEEIGLIRESCNLLSKTLGYIRQFVLPGVTTSYIDMKAEGYIREHGALPSFKGYKGFPNALCISVNDTVVHGIPSDYCLCEGDIVSVDCGVYMNGFHADSAYTFEVGNITSDVKQLLDATKKALYLGISKALTGNRIGDISYTIQDFAERSGYSVVRELVGHGIGRNLHEEPQVPNFGKKGKGTVIRQGMVLAIEPMINMGKKDVRSHKDGWTISTADGKPSAHFEHTIAIRNGETEILTTFDYIEKFKN